MDKAEMAQNDKIKDREIGLDVNFATSAGTPASFQAPSIVAAQSPDKTTLDKIQGAIHLAGIGGIGMSALARLLLAQGFKVSGSDKQSSEITQELEQSGAVIHYGHKAENLKNAGALIISTAIQKGNPELDEALRLNIPVFHRSELLNFLSRDQKLIAVTGTHGKTTTSAMVGQTLLDCGFDPSVVVGGIFDRIKANSYHGKGQYFVAESDESDGTHASATPHIALITNIEPDHLENYPGGFEQIMKSIEVFVDRTTGFAVICREDKGCLDLLRRLEARPQTRMVTYGTDAQCSYRLVDLGGKSFEVWQGERLLGQVDLIVPGFHNKLNALSALAIALELGADFTAARAAIGSFAGVDRRFQLIGKKAGITIVDDYAHHPTEVIALLKAARQHAADARVVCVFQPHQPGRLRDLWNEFVGAFNDCDEVIILDIYIARGGAIEGIDSARFVQALQQNARHPNASHLAGSIQSVAETMAPRLKPGDLVLTVGAGDVTRLGPLLLQNIQNDR